MTPTVGWTELDYYRARDSARSAWQRTNAQLELGLDEPEMKRADATAAAVSGSSSPPSAAAGSPRGGLDVPAEEAGAGTPPTTEAPEAISVSSASAGPPKHTRRDGANPCRKRAVPQKERNRS